MGMCRSCRSGVPDGGGQKPTETESTPGATRWGADEVHWPCCPRSQVAVGVRKGPELGAQSWFRH